MYYNPPRSAARDSTVRKALTRSYIWGCIKGSDPSSIGVYQPEDDGYKVLSIYKGIYKYVPVWLLVTNSQILIIKKHA